MSKNTIYLNGNYTLDQLQAILEDSAEIIEECKTCMCQSCLDERFEVIDESDCEFCGMGSEEEDDRHDQPPKDV